MMVNNKEKVTYTIVSSTRKEYHQDIISSNGEYMATFKEFQDACDYIGSYLEYKDIIDGKIDLVKYKVA